MGEELIFLGPLGLHYGNILAAASGASTRDLMHRMGHGSMQAAPIYQHATSERDQEITAALDAPIKREAGQSGPYVARGSPNVRATPGVISLKAGLSRGDAVERVTRIELA